MTIDTSRPSISSKARNAWVSKAWLWQLIFWGHVIILTVVAMVDPATTNPVRVRIVLLMIVFVGINLVMVRYFIAPSSHEQREKGFDAFVYIAMFLLCLIWFFIAQTHYIFFFLLTILYTEANRYIPWRWVVPFNLFLTATLVAAANGISMQVLVNWRNPMWWGALLSMGAVTCASAWLAAVITQSEERRHLIEELKRTRQDLAVAERDAGVLAERERLAREIHDTLAQGFTSIILHLQAAEQALPLEHTDVIRHVDQAQQMARTSLDQARRVVDDLRPRPLEQATSFGNALQRVAHAWAKAAEIKTTIEVTGDPRYLHPDVETTILRTLQEALANVRKHADATEVNVTLSYMEDMIILDVQDNGIGMKPNAADDGLSSGFGLTSMQERVRQLDGNLLIESAPSDGTTIAIAIPT